MKYLDRNDYIEIGIILLIGVAILAFVTVIGVCIYYTIHATPTGCLPK